VVPEDRKGVNFHEKMFFIATEVLENYANEAERPRNIYFEEIIKQDCNEIESTLIIPTAIGSHSPRGP